MEGSLPNESNPNWSVQKLGHFYFESSQRNARCIFTWIKLYLHFVYMYKFGVLGLFYFLILRWLLGRWQARQKNQENPFFKNTGVGFTGLSFAISLWWMIYWYIAPLLGWFRLWPWHRFTRDFLIIYIIHKSMANHVNINTSIREIIRIWVNLFCLELDEISRPLAACCSLLQPPFCPLQMPIKVSTIQIK